MKLLRVNMGELSTTVEELDEEFRYWGNRGLIAKLLLKEVAPTCHPLGKYNKLIFANGPVSGTGIPGGNRLSAGGKSPLTGGIKESNTGGIVGLRLARQGFRAIIVESKPAQSHQYILVISQQGANLVEAGELVGLGNYAVCKALREEYGHKAGVITIGPAGERMQNSAAIFTTGVDGLPGCVCARGGLGAVMGSKGLKAVVIKDDGTYALPIKDRMQFQEKVKEFNKIIIANPQTGKTWHDYSTVAVVPSMNAIGGLPTNNFKSGSFEGAEKISGDVLHDLINERSGEGKNIHVCMPGCIIKCYNAVPNPEGKLIVSPLQYETVAMMGSNLGISDLDDIAIYNYLANDIGIDTIEVGVAIGIAMEAGCILPFGDSEGVLKLLKEIETNSILGQLLSAGAEITGKVLGVFRVPVVKGQAIPAHEPRHIKGTGVTFCVSPQGADHTAGVTLRSKIDHTKPTGQVEASRNVQISVAAFDTLGMCSFYQTGLGTQSALMIDLLKAVYGEKLNENFLSYLGKETLKAEHEFNLAAGFTKAHDRLPEFMYEEKIKPNDLIFDVPQEEIEKFWDYFEK